MEILPYKKGDATVLMALMFDSTRVLCKNDYTPEELSKWVPERMDKARFMRSLALSYVRVAHMDGEIVGFADMDESGYLNRLFVAPDFGRRGVGTALLNEMEKHAKKKGIHTISLISSITSKGFYQKNGYTLLGEKYLSVKPVRVKGYKMEKRMEGSGS